MQHSARMDSSPGEPQLESATSSSSSNRRTSTSLHSLPTRSTAATEPSARTLASVRALYPSLLPSAQHQLALLADSGAGVGSASSPRANGRDPRSLSPTRLRALLSSDLLSGGTVGSQGTLLRLLRDFARRGQKPVLPEANTEESHIEGSARALDLVPPPRPRRRTHAADSATSGASSRHTNRTQRPALLPALPLSTLVPATSSSLSSPHSAREHRAAHSSSLAGKQQPTLENGSLTDRPGRRPRSKLPPPPEPLPLTPPSPSATSSAPGASVSRNRHARKPPSSSAAADALSTAALLDTAKGASTALGQALGLASLSLSHTGPQPLTAEERLRELCAHMPLVSDEYEWNNRTGRMMLRTASQTGDETQESKQQTGTQPARSVSLSTTVCNSAPSSHSTPSNIELLLQQSLHPAIVRSSLPPPRVDLPIESQQPSDQRAAQSEEQLLVSVRIEHEFDADEAERAWSAAREAQRALEAEYAAALAAEAAVSGVSSASVPAPAAAASSYSAAVALADGSNRSSNNVRSATACIASPSRQKASQERFWRTFFDMKPLYSADATSKGAASTSRSANSGTHSRSSGCFTSHSLFRIRASDTSTQATYRLDETGDHTSPPAVPLARLQQALERLYRSVCERHATLSSQNVPISPGNSTPIGAPSPGRRSQVACNSVQGSTTVDGRRITTIGLDAAIASGDVRQQQTGRVRDASAMQPTNGASEEKEPSSACGNGAVTPASTTAALASARDFLWTALRALFPHSPFVKGELLQQRQQRESDNTRRLQDRTEKLERATRRVLGQHRHGATSSSRSLHSSIDGGKLYPSLQTFTSAPPLSHSVAIERDKQVRAARDELQAERQLQHETELRALEVPHLTGAHRTQLAQLLASGLQLKSSSGDLRLDWNVDLAVRQMLSQLLGESASA